MSDYIERDKIMNFCNAVINRQGNEEEMNVVVESFKAFAEYVKALPPAQPDRTRGRWTPHREKSREYIGATLIYVTYDYWSCDTCGYRVEDGQPLYNFCPHCGADMRGDTT